MPVDIVGTGILLLRAQQALNLRPVYGHIADCHLRRRIPLTKAKTPNAQEQKQEKEQQGQGKGQHQGQER